MKQRNIWGILLLNVVTFGIYELFWTKSTRDELVAKGQDVPRFILLFAPFLAMVALLTAGLIAFSSSDNDTAEASINIVLALGMLISVFAAIGIAIWWFYRYSKAVEVVTKGQISFGMAYGLWWLLHFFGVSFIWPLLIQDGFNKVGEDGTPSNPVAGPKPGQIPDTPYPTNTTFSR